MTFKLNQQPVAGESYTRSPQVVIDNRMGRTPTITFHREMVLGTAGGSVMCQPMAPNVLAFDPQASVPVINPETGEPTGDTVTHGEIYALLFSAFVAAETPDTTIEETP